MEENKGEEMKGVEWKQKVGLEVENKHYFGYGIILYTRLQGLQTSQLIIIFGGYDITI